MTAALLDALNAAARRALAESALQPFAPAAALAEADRALAGLAFGDGGEPPLHPVVERDLARARVRHARAAALHRALIEAAPALTWLGGETGYGGEPGMEAFNANYAFTALAAPEAWVSPGGAATEEIGLSFTVQGPGATYPPHVHKAVEIYYVVAGKALWKRGGEPWVERYPGESILHTAGMRHAMRTLDEPLVAMAVWLGDANSPIAVVRA